MTWMIPRTTPRDPSGSGASNRGTPDPSDGITPICPSARTSSNCLPSNVSAPLAASPLFPHGDTEDSEQIEIEVCAYRRVIRRRRYRRTCTCDGPITLTAPPPPKLIPKGRYGISVWVEILLDKYFSYRPTERLLASWRLWGLDLAAGTVTDGLQRLEVLLRPIYEALKERNPQGDLHQADETRWRVFVALEGKQGYGWWLWVVLGPDTVVYRAGCQSQSRGPRGPLSGRVARGAGGRSLFGLQGDDLGQGRGRGPGLLLGSCAAGLHPGGQGLAGVEDVGLGMAAADSRALPAERPPVGGREGLGGVRGSGRLPAPGGGRDEGADGDANWPGRIWRRRAGRPWKACKSIGKG